MGAAEKGRPKGDWQTGPVIRRGLAAAMAWPKRTKPACIGKRVRVVFLRVAIPAKRACGARSGQGEAITLDISSPVTGYVAHQDLPPSEGWDFIGWQAIRGFRTSGRQLESWSAPTASIQAGVSSDQTDGSFAARYFAIQNDAHSSKIEAATVSLPITTLRKVRAIHRPTRNLNNYWTCACVLCGLGGLLSTLRLHEARLTWEIDCFQSHKEFTNKIWLVPKFVPAQAARTGVRDRINVHAMRRFGGDLA